MRLLRLLPRLVIAALLLASIALLASVCQAQRREVLTAAEAAPTTGHFVHAGDVDLFVQESGPPQGPAVLLVHGTGAWSETWRESMTAFAGAGYRAIAVDLPPFGYSQRPASGDYSRRAQGERFVAVLDTLEVRDVTLVGHSFGAGPTVEAALIARGRVRALV